MVEGKVGKNFRDELEVKIQEISLLADVMEKQTRVISVVIPLSRLTNDLVKGFEEIAKNAKGKTRIGIKVVDNGTESITMKSVNIKVDPSALLKFLTDEKLKFKIN
jgi:hypothetical protein